MDIAVAALIITGACLVGLICFGGAISLLSQLPKTVKCPKCKTRSSLADIALSELREQEAKD